MGTRTAKGLSLAAALVASRRTIASIADFLDLMQLEIALEQELNPARFRELRPDL